MTAVNDSVQNHSPAPHFFIGSSPSMARKIISNHHPAAGVMVSVNSLIERKSDFEVGTWILDSGAFTEVARHGGYRHQVDRYYQQICRWASCGKLLAAVAQDWMCEPFVIEKTGLSICDHQRLTIERYDQLLKLDPPVAVMPVLQGYRSSDYLKHLIDYGDRLKNGQWVGVGSVCKRNGKPSEVADILKTLKLVRPDLKLHGFGLKIIALENPEVKSLLYSCDSMAWSYPLRFQPTPGSDFVQNQEAIAHEYQTKIATAPKRLPPSTAGAGNGQGRKPKWKTKTTAIRIPKKYADRLIALAHEWELE